MSLMDRLRGLLAARLTSPEQETSRDRVAWIGSRLYSTWMSAEDALRLSAVWACCTVIAKSVAASNWEVYREDLSGNRQLMRRSQLWWLLNVRPNPDMTALAFREAALMLALMRGNFFAEIERDTMGRPVALHPLADERVCLERDAAGEIICRVTNHGRADVILPYQDVFHLHGPGIDGVAGYDVIREAARTLAHAAAAETFGLAYYQNGATLGGTLTSEKPLTEAQIKEYREQISSTHAGADKAFKVMLLPAGMKFEPFKVENDTAQFIETRFLMIEEVCRWFGVPPHKVAHLLRATNNNIEHQGIEFTRDALVPWCERLRQECDWKLVQANSIWTRIDLDWLSEGDAKSRAESDGLLFEKGICTLNEVRRRRGLNSIGPDGDVHMVQMQMQPIERAINPPEPAPPPAPAEPAPPPADEQAAMAQLMAMERIYVS